MVRGALNSGSRRYIARGESRFPGRLTRTSPTALDAQHAEERDAGRMPSALTVWLCER